jgi:hypothetical protein
MTADEVRERLEKELGGTFAEATWKRLSRDNVREYLERQNRTEWESLKEVASDLFEYEKELKQELASGGGSERTPRKRRQRQRKAPKNQEAVEEHWSPSLATKKCFASKSTGSTWRRSPLLIYTWRVTAGGC